MSCAASNLMYYYVCIATFSLLHIWLHLKTKPLITETSKLTSSVFSSPEYNREAHSLHQDHNAAFKSKTTMEVLRALLVYKLCGIDQLVDNNEMVGLSHVQYGGFSGIFPYGYDKVSAIMII